MSAPTSIADIVQFLEQFAPPQIAADWDNVGLLLGDAAAHASRVMTCLTLTPASVAEAIDDRAALVVSHHPLPFRPLRQITTASHAGRLLWDLARAGIAVYSPHTAFDSCPGGINDQLAGALGLIDAQPLEALSVGGVGRWGRLARPMSLKDFLSAVKKALGIETLQAVGSPELVCQQVAVACGSAGDLLDKALEQGCDTFVTGEARFHTCVEAEAAGIALILAGHYATERPGVEQLAVRLGSAFPAVNCWVSKAESDPLTWR